MKFDDIPHEEWASPPDPRLVHGEGPEGEQPPPPPPAPAALIAAAAERLNARARADVNQLRSSLDRPSTRPPLLLP